MRRTKRWLLMFAALAGFMAIHVEGLRATSLIFGRSTTTTTTTTESLPLQSDDEEVNDESYETTTTNGTNTPKLTGIPQIDYIWDPNLPRELNGYNLSDYPFLVTVPPQEEIDFKCDGLHDGFYASVKYNCQLYHHCLYGIRYDFLCANFTAFDQKTFICHFVSEVDCKNSAKYFFRNDALYKNPTTTTTTTTTIAPPSTTAAAVVTPARPLSRPRRPLRRRRPQVDYYYDEDYDEEEYEDPPPRRRKQRPRNRRPEYDDYPTDERYNRREPSYGAERERNRQDDDDYVYDRRPINDRPRNRNKPIDNRRYNDEIENKRKPLRDYDDRRSSAYDDDKRYRRPAYDDRKQGHDDRRQLDHDRRISDDDRRPVSGDRRKNYDDRRPAYDDRRTYPDEYDDERPSIKRPQKDDAPNDDTPKVKPSGSGGLFDRPRVPPKIRRPVPINERDKYDYKTSKPNQQQSTQSPDDSEYYEDYEEPPHRPQTPVPPPQPQSPPKQQNNRDETIRPIEYKKPEITNKRENFKRPESPHAPPVELKRPPPLRDDEYYEDEYDDHRPKFPSKTQNVREIIKDEANNNHESYVSLSNKNNNQPISRPTYKVSSRDPFRSPQPSRFSSVEESLDIRQPQSSHVVKQNYQSDRQSESTSYSNFKPKQSQKEYVNPFATRPLDSAIPKRDERDPYVRLQDRDRESYTIIDRDYPMMQREEISFKGFNYDSNKGIQTKSPTMSSIRAPYDYPMNRPSPITSSEEDRVREVRPIVRVVKRPFLPSRGGSPYLPRGLQPVGKQSEVNRSNKELKSEQLIAKNEQNEEVKEYDQDQHNRQNIYQQHQNQRLPSTTTTTTSTTTFSPPIQINSEASRQNDLPRVTLDEIYDSEYDVTLNDALNPTLKPLTPSRGSPIGFTIDNKYERSRLTSYNPAELKISPSQIRKTAIRPPERQIQNYDSRTPITDSEFYEEYDY